MKPNIAQNDTAGGQQRHALGTLTALLVGANIGDTEQIQAFITILESVGVSQQIQIIIGALVLAGVHAASWWSKRKKEGDPE